MSTSKTTIRVAMAQMKLDWGRADANLSHAVDMIGAGAAEDCDVVLLPECLDIGWTHPDAAEFAAPVPGPRSETLAGAARRHGVWVVAGLTERDGDLTYNSAVLISPDGELALKYRKINLLEIAQPFYEVGDRLGVARTPFGKVGVNICADNFRNVLVFAHCLGRMGARIILSPCAWAVDADNEGPYGSHWEEAYSAVAPLYDMPVVGVSNVGWVGGGPWEGRKCIGNSLAVDADGNVVATGPFGADAEAVIPVELELRPQPAIGTAMSPLLRERGYTGP
ncbi:MAG: carbon-nitrogen hydrolase family protein [Candidatus Brocadiia bacterium]